MNDDLILWPRHARQARICMNGARRWAEVNGIDWGVFVREGLRVSSLTEAQREDPFMVRAIAWAQAEADNGKKG